MMISIIAPCLNEERYLPYFFEGLLRQYLKNFEVIIVDGGSTDKSLKLIMKYKRKLARYDVQVKIVKTGRRNFGFIRNFGAKHANGDILFHANTDNYFPPDLLFKLQTYYNTHWWVYSVSGRVYPLGTSVIAHLGYQLFDLLRFTFTCAPVPVKKYRPSGNFMTVRAKTFWMLGGHPEVHANEDGLFGAKFDKYLKKNHRMVRFNLNLYVGHWVKKFEQMGGIHAIFFYFYTLGNFAPILKPLLEPILRNANSVFKGESKNQLTLRQVLYSMWDWL